MARSTGRRSPLFHRGQPGARGSSRRHGLFRASAKGQTSITTHICVFIHIYIHTQVGLRAEGGFVETPWKCSIKDLGLGLVLGFLNSSVRPGRASNKGLQTRKLAAEATKATSMCMNHKLCGRCKQRNDMQSICESLFKVPHALIPFIPSREDERVGSALHRPRGRCQSGQSEQVTKAEQIQWLCNSSLIDDDNNKHKHTMRIAAQHHHRHHHVVEFLSFQQLEVPWSEDTETSLRVECFLFCFLVFSVSNHSESRKPGGLNPSRDKESSQRFAV